MKDATHIRIEFGFGIGRDKDGMSISRDEANAALADIKQEAARLFQGYTLVSTYGGWTNDSGRHVEEDGFTLFTVQPCESMGDADQWDVVVERFARFIKLSLNQEAVAVTTSEVRFGIL